MPLREPTRLNRQPSQVSHFKIFKISIPAQKGNGIDDILLILDRLLANQDPSTLQAIFVQIEQGS